MLPLSSQPESESGSIFSRVSDRHIWNTITHRKPRAISRDLRLVTDWSRNQQTQFSFRFLIVGGRGEKKKGVLNAGMNAANIGPDLRYYRLS